MEHSGHLSTSGIRSYECMTVEQQKQVSDILSKGKKPLELVKSNKCATSRDEKALLAVNVPHVLMTKRRTLMKIRKMLWHLFLSI